MFALVIEKLSYETKLKVKSIFETKTDYLFLYISYVLCVSFAEK